MISHSDAQLMRIYLSNTDKFRHQPVYEVIVYAAKRYGMSGATVLKGIMGFGGGSQINAMSFFEIADKLPIIVEIVDEADKIDQFYKIIEPYFDKINKRIMVTIEKVNVVFVKH